MANVIILPQSEAAIRQKNINIGDTVPLEPDSYRVFADVGSTFTIAEEAEALVLVSTATVTGTSYENSTRTIADTLVWSLDGQTVIPEAIVFRTLIDGVVVGDEDSSFSYTLPNNVGASFAREVQATDGVVQSVWFQVDSGVIGVTPSITSTQLTGGNFIFNVNDVESQDDLSVTLTITDPSALSLINNGDGNGVFTFNLSDLETGPYVLSPPRIIQSGEGVGDTLTAIGAISINSATVPTTTSIVWYRDGVVVDEADISGSQITLTESDLGSSFYFNEVEVAQNGTTTTRSLETISIPAAFTDPYTPLFADNEDGIVMVFGSDFGTCYQEITGAAATTPCANGDPVGTYFDSITGKYITAPTEGQRPIYVVDGNGRVALDFGPFNSTRLTVPIDMSGTSQLTMVAAFDYVDDTITGIGRVIEFTLDSTTAGGFGINQNSNGDGSQIVGGGTTPQFEGTGSGFTGGVSAVVGGLIDIPANRMDFRVNGALFSSDTVSDLGTGNFANDTLYIGGRGPNNQSPFSGLIYGLVVRSKLTEGTDLTGLEDDLKLKAGVV